MTRYKINPKLLPVKAHYFLYNAAGAALWPFVPVIGKQMGISAAGVGICYAVAPVVGFFAKPTVGMIADFLRKRKLIFALSILVTLLSAVSIAFLPQANPDRPVTFECGNSGTNYIKQCGTHCGSSSGAGDGTFLEFILKGEEEQSQNSSSSATYPNIVEERCQVRCLLHSARAVSSFCQNLYLEDKYQPELCKNDPSGENSSVVTSAVLEFNTTLKISSATHNGDCLYLPVLTLSFQSGLPSYQPFSCLPNKTELETCFADCPSNAGLNKRLEKVVEDPHMAGTAVFWFYGLLVVISVASMAVGTSLSDALCFQVLGDQPHRYGMQRQWGAVGWGIFTFVAGYLVDTGSVGQLLKDYTPCFYILTGLYFLDLVVVYKWDIQEMERPKAIRKDISNLMVEPRILVFLMACFVIGMCTSMHWQFLFWHVEELAMADCDTMRWLKVLQGLMVMVQCFAEIPFFYFAGWFTKKLGYVNCFTLVLFAFGLRFVLYSVLKNPWAFIPMELFQGVTFGIFYSNMAAYASFISPPGASATVQGLVGASFEGIGMALGSLLAGYFFKIWSGPTAFLAFGLGSFFFCALHAIIMFFLGTKEAFTVPISPSEPEGEEMFKISRNQNGNGTSENVDLILD